ncbi:vesicle-associated protein 2-2-like [Asparagus officinalis]|nr:vesicle-associated protein 2-2-like [Asparagus officinalis]XP_020267463.1 vesicle-associated protein 2-2-like [Asparagus officinalis]
METEELIEIQPREIKFTFEVKKQSSCLVHLVNKTNEYVAFKVKTTSPKRYCVRPNTGVILPRSTCDFTVTMQAQKTAPPDMQLKDKFLIQSTIAPHGSGDENIEPALFSKASGKYIGENKLRVVLVSPPHSPGLQPVNGALKQEPTNETSVVEEAPIVKETPIASILKETPIAPIGKETPITPGKETPVAPVVKEIPISPVEKETGIAPVVKETQMAPMVKGTPILPVVEEAAIAPVEKETPTSKDCTPLNGVHDIPSSQVRDLEDLKLKVSNLESKLFEADKTIVTLRKEKSFAIQERDGLKEELALMRRRYAAKVRVGFPFLYVVFMALVGASLGYLLHQ